MLCTSRPSHARWSGHQASGSWLKVWGKFSGRATAGVEPVRRVGAPIVAERLTTSAPNDGSTSPPRTSSYDCVYQCRACHCCAPTLSGVPESDSMTARRNRRKKVPARQREHRRHGCWDHLIVAPLWVAYQANLGTLLRTCDAVGACMAVPATSHYRKSLDHGDTLPRRPHLHWIDDSKPTWIRKQQAEGKRLVVVELSDTAIPLSLLEPAREPTVL